MEEKSSTVEFQSLGDTSSWRFTWTIDNFSKLNVKKLYSDIFSAGGYKWRILIFPKGNIVDHLSMYLDVADSETLSSGWSRYAQFSLSVVNQVHSRHTVKRDTQHMFNARESDCGFASFIPLTELNSSASGFILKDTCIVVAEVRLNRLEESEADLYTIVKVARDEDLTKQIGKDTYFDHVDHDKVHSFIVKNEEPFYQFKEKVAKEFGIPKHCQRFWRWAAFENHLYRFFKPLTSLEERQTVGELGEFSSTEICAELKLFLEVELDSDMQPVAPPEKTDDDTILFFKHYDPLKEELRRYVGRLFANKHEEPVEILTKLNKMAGFTRNDKIELFEERRFEVEPYILSDEPSWLSFAFGVSPLVNGGVIWFQKVRAEISGQCRYPDIPSFFQFVRGLKRQESTFGEIGSSSFAALDMLFSDINYVLKGYSASLQPSQLTDNEIAAAWETFEKCLAMKLVSVIKLGRALEFKNSLSNLLTANAFPDDMVDEMTKFLANFDRSCELYMSAEQELRDAKEMQNSVSRLKTVLKELSFEFTPIRNRAKEVDQEVAELEGQLAERKEEKTKLRTSLEDLAGRASTSRQALINAEQEMKLFMHRKEQAEETVGDIERSWESLKKEYYF
ncbi:ubiquitin carboxyl-terminal hydrolase 12 isoform X1 [Morus notabilis]|uniref:ubiquitin carboxyl-terminal hydrolase 12 isoform X1 n=1 Tax=Morus notabilis TaxID=981085 RepID=UPI000CED45B5|nr:ubiquitin carboxyl-terminal hydrolase 12 isoform X1 [Morus notabilis]